MSKIRKSFSEVIKTGWNKYIIITSIALLVYVSIIVFVLHRVEFWHLSNLKDTIYWVLGVAFIMLVNHDKANEDGFFKRILLSYITLVFVLEFLIQLYVFSIWVERSEERRVGKECRSRGSPYP